jgi:hypothetical protein
VKTFLKAPLLKRGGVKNVHSPLPRGVIPIKFSKFYRDQGVRLLFDKMILNRV